MSLYTQSGGRMPGWLNAWLKVNESQKQVLWIKSVVAEESYELIYDEIFCANAKNIITLTLGKSTLVYSYIRMRNKKIILLTQNTHISLFILYGKNLRSIIKISFYANFSTLSQ